MNKLLLILPVLIFGLISCDNGIEKSEELVEISTGNENKDLIRNELTADGKVDTVNVPKIKFETPVYDFGEISEGEKVNYSFKFKNVGNKSLVIKDARSTCGCTVPKKPKEGIVEK